MNVGDVPRRIESLYFDDLSRPCGLIHVCSGWRIPSGEILSLRIDPNAPVSEMDRFVLGLSRARVDAIVTTGKILRDEPELEHNFEGPDGEALMAWRREVRGLAQPPLSVVLTSGRDWNPDHPLIRGNSRALIFTSEEAALEIAPKDSRPSWRVIGHPAPSLASLVAYLKEDLGMGDISLEVGPSSVKALYAQICGIDECLRSLFLGDDMSPSQLGAPWPEDRLLGENQLRLASECRLEQESGPWLFQRFRVEERRN